jgi:hypothetical protein
MALFTALFSLLGLIALGGGVLNVRPGIIDAELIRNMSFPILAAVGPRLGDCGIRGRFDPWQSARIALRFKIRSTKNR